MPAGLGTLFAGLLLIALAFVEGASVWRVLHTALFGVFGCGSLVLGVAVCGLAILYTRGEDLLPCIFKLLLGLVFASGTVIVFSDIPAQGVSASQMVAACYRNGYEAWLSGGALGALLGGTLLILCGRPAANLVMGALAVCASLYIFDVTPAEVWQAVCGVLFGVREKGVAVYEHSQARRAERLAARQAEQEAWEAEQAAREQAYEEAAGPEESDAGAEDALEDDPDAGFRVGLPGWISGVMRWGHQVTQGAADEPPEAPSPEPPQPQPAPVRAEAPRPRAPFDIDLGPDHAPVTEGGSEPIEPIILGPGGTFGMNPLRGAPRPVVKPIVPDAVETAAQDFFTPVIPVPPEPAPQPAPQFAAEQDPLPSAAPEAEPQPAAAETEPRPAAPVEPAVAPAAPPRVSAENAVAWRSAPDEEGWISITSEPVEEKDLNTLVAAAMEKPAASE